MSYLDLAPVKFGILGCTLVNCGITVVDSDKIYGWGANYDIGKKFQVVIS